MEHSHHLSHEELYQCPECGLWYGDIEWEKKCEIWCKEHKSCNLEIIGHSVLPHSTNHNNLLLK